MDKPASENKYLILWRQGTPTRCRWVEILRRFDTRQEALHSDVARETERMGYKIMVKTVREHLHGLPIGWDASTNEADWVEKPDGFWHYAPAEVPEA